MTTPMLPDPDEPMHAGMPTPREIAEALGETLPEDDDDSALDMRGCGVDGSDIDMTALFDTGDCPACQSPDTVAGDDEDPRVSCRSCGHRWDARAEDEDEIEPPDVGEMYDMIQSLSDALRFHVGGGESSALVRNADDLLARCRDYMNL